LIAFVGNEQKAIGCLRNLADEKHKTDTSQQRQFFLAIERLLFVMLAVRARKVSALVDGEFSWMHGRTIRQAGRQVNS